MDYGTQVLSHPLVADAAASLFVPLCIYNNTAEDPDAGVRQAFREPAWNNPVLRVVDAQRRDLVPRLDGDWTVAGTLEQMVRALDTTPGRSPEWLRLLAAEAEGHRRGVETAIFGMT